MTMHSFVPDRTGRERTPALWRGIPFNELLSNPRLGFAAHWDFCGFDNDLWTVTNATSGTLAAISGHGGVVRVSAGAATDAQGVRSAQPGGAASQFITPAAGRIIVVEALLKDTPQTSTLNSRWFGLATQTTGLGTAGDPDGTDRIGFIAENDANIKFNYKDASATEYEVDTTYDVTSGNWTKWGFRINGLSSVEWTVNGVAPTIVAATTTYAIPDAIMNITLANVANGGTGTPTTDFDWIDFAVYDEQTSVVTV